MRSAVPNTRLAAFVLLLVELSSVLACAVDHPLGGKVLVLRDAGTPSAHRSVRFRSSDGGGLDALPRMDPRAIGATLEIRGSGPDDGLATVELGAAGWLPDSSRRGGYRWIDRAQTQGVRKVHVRRSGVVAITGGGPAWPYTVAHAQGPVDIRLTIGVDTYCARFTTFVTNGPGVVRARNAPPPAACAPAGCGDGVARWTEECDDGNLIGGDGCSSSCLLETTAAVCAGVAPATTTRAGFVQIAGGLTRPIHLTAPPLDPARLFVVEQEGRIRLVKNGVLLPTPFLSMEDKVSCCGERGLLSVAFHPDYERNGRLFVHYTNPAGENVVARYETSADLDRADDASEVVLLRIAQPSSSHQGGLNVFGPDGYLYVGVGDGTPPDSSVLETTAQDDTTLLGKILRLDVDVEAPPYHRVPPDNPRASAPDPENLMWAKGFRNPWRFSFDRATGDLYVSDVGEHTWEEIDVQPAGMGGSNYGWDIFEGRHCFEPAPLFPECPDPPIGYTMPVLEYDHSEGCAVVGGFVYRGCAFPALRGTFFFSDFCTGFLRTFDGVVDGEAHNVVDRTADMAPVPGPLRYVSSFGEDARGELYVLSTGFFPATGAVYQLVPRP